MHNSLLHLPKDPVRGEEEKKVKAMSLSTCVANRTFMATALVTVSCVESEKQSEARCLLDNCSQSSFISRKFKDKLAIQGQVVESVCITGVNGMAFEVVERCKITVKSRVNAYSTTVDAFIVDKITSEMPNNEIDTSGYTIPTNLTLADPHWNIPAEPDLLLAADVFWDIITSGKIKLGPGNPIIHNSMFGWLVAGSARFHDDFESKGNLVCNFSHSIRNQLQKFWELEEVPNKPVLSQEEEACEQHFVQHTRRLEDGRFCVTLPLKIEPQELDTFVSHRVAEVNELCADAPWMYVPSASNPADLASRGVYPDEVQSLSLWWEGPTFLKEAQEKWPSQHSDDTQTDLPEIKNGTPLAKKVDRRLGLHFSVEVSQSQLIVSWYCRKRLHFGKSTVMGVVRSGDILLDVS
ncbi:putative peptidase (DUF1758) domain-containing protein [Phthorimaea operculella]|nr:putative peptidase (DUF1758) domain-containing protein [Phthorimaea operculella]